MEQEKLQELKDRLWKTKNEEEWKAVCADIATAVANDEPAKNYMHKYAVSIKDKKMEWFKKAQNKPIINKPPVFNDETQKAMQNAFNAMADYFKAKAQHLQIVDTNPTQFDYL